MKKIFTIISLVAVTTLLHAQGYIDFTGSAAAISTNTGLFLINGSEVTGTSGRTATTAAAPGAYDYALLYSATAITGNAAPTNTEWNLMAPQAGGTLIGNNGVGVGTMTGNGGSGGVQVNVSGTYFVELVGWSASLGSSWGTVLNELDSSTWTAPGYFGYTDTPGSLTTGSTPGGAGDPTVFTGMFSNGSLTLYAVPVPEPATIALASLGGLSLLAFRRRNKA
jgi:hypothetical protein